MLKKLLTLNLVLLFSSAGVLSRPSSAHPSYRHAYYLFLAGAPKGCEECYVPLLITHESLERLSETDAKEDSLLIITYERDSIWHDDGIVSVAFSNIDVATRMIDLRNRKYRYQEISSEEVLRLLKKPLGKIPISRPLLPQANVPGPGLAMLIADFEKQK